jgi:hypothetical protein
MNRPDCSTIIGEATTDGANMVTNYLTLKFDSYFTYLSMGVPLLAQPDIKTTATFVYFYLNKMADVNNEAFASDYQHYVGVLTDRMLIFTGVALILTLFILVLMWNLKKFFEKHERQEDILLTIPFDKLKTLASFHKFYEKYYEQY